MDYRRFLRKIREDSNLTKEDIAQKFNISVYNVAAFERGQKDNNRLAFYYANLMKNHDDCTLSEYSNYLISLNSNSKEV